MKFNIMSLFENDKIKIVNQRLFIGNNDNYFSANRLIFTVDANDLNEAALSFLYSTCDEFDEELNDIVYITEDLNPFLKRCNIKCKKMLKRWLKNNKITSIKFYRKLFIFNEDFSFIEEIKTYRVELCS